MTNGTDDTSAETVTFREIKHGSKLSANIVNIELC